MRQLNLLDYVISEIDTTLRTLVIPKSRTASRDNPGNEYPENQIDNKEKRHIAGLMRVNHTGEVCAQALYQGQAMTAQLANIKAQMAQAAAEEVDHLAWCEQRLQELDSKPGALNPFWYTSSLMLGILAGLAGDKWSLGFVAETERQVTAHLENHLQRIPEKDQRTIAIIKQMHEDESRHAAEAQNAGAAQLPWFIKTLMKSSAKFMTKSSYYL
jgi:ubiquinone biosynthesis monooxygenase Coq7